ncbi:hypothetical protein T484DRAFT_1780273 [Baffinella frigidus]|nr:hypothetical protein T484DRAFT_1780273 [Cryptophyta sp. CCMP2293]
MIFQGSPWKTPAPNNDSTFLPSPAPLNISLEATPGRDRIFPEDTDTILTPDAPSPDGASPPGSGQDTARHQPPPRDPAPAPGDTTSSCKATAGIRGIKSSITESPLPVPKSPKSPRPEVSKFRDATTAQNSRSEASEQDPRPAQLTVCSRLDPDAARFMQELAGEVGESDTITVVSSDGKAVAIPYGVAQRSRLLRWKKRMQGHERGHDAGRAPVESTAANKGSGSANEERGSANEDTSEIRLKDPSCTERNLLRVCRYMELVVRAEAGLSPVAALLEAEADLVKVDDRGLFDLLAGPRP